MPISATSRDLKTSTLSMEQDSSFRMVAFGEYAADGTASAMKMRDYKDATDLVVAR